MASALGDPVSCKKRTLAVGRKHNRQLAPGKIRCTGTGFVPRSNHRSTGVQRMSQARMRAGPIILTLFVSGVIGCSWGWGNDPYYSYGYPWSYDNYGTYTVVRR